MQDQFGILYVTTTYGQQHFKYLKMLTNQECLRVGGLLVEEYIDRGKVEYKFLLQSCNGRIYYPHQTLIFYNQFRMSRQKRRSVSLSSIVEKDLKRPEFDWIISFATQFRNNVEEPITMRETLMRNKDSQRCLTHSILYSLYCTVCRKILCASCMYSTSTHRKHRVIPVDNAADQIRDDLKNFEAKIPKTLERCNGIINANSDYLVRMEREYTPMIALVQEFYQNLRAFLKNKEKEQLAELRETKEQLRAEITSYNKELSRMHQFMSEKLKAYCLSNIKSNILIPSRNILENLMQASSFIRQPQFDVDDSKFNTDPSKFKTIFEEITYKVSRIVAKPILPKDASGKKPNLSTKSVDNKSKPSSLAVGSKREQGVVQGRKRTNSSVAVGRTIRHI